MAVTRLLRGPGLLAHSDRVIVCVGLAIEAEIAVRQFSAVVEGPAQDELSEVIGRAADAGCRGIVSFGLAGGLSDQLDPGAIVVASEVVEGKVSFRTDDAWSAWLLSAIPAARYAPLVGVDSAVTVRAARRELETRSGAVAVDMESHTIGRIAAIHRLRFVAVRVVIDAVDRRVPRAALACLSSDGETNLSQLVRLLLARPADTLDFVRLWTDWIPARKALVSCCEVLGTSICEVGRGTRSGGAGKPEL